MGWLGEVKVNGLIGVDEMIVEGRGGGGVRWMLGEQDWHQPPQAFLSLFFCTSF
jgi:hypothetical protein